MMVQKVLHRKYWYQCIFLHELIILLDKKKFMILENMWTSLHMYKFMKN